MNADGVTAQVHHGIARFQAGDTAAALHAFNGALDADPQQNRARAYRGRVYHRLGRKDAALADFNAALDREPNQPNWYAWRAIVRIASWEFDKALADLNTALRLAPGTWEFHLLRGHARYHLREADAASDYQAAFELEPREMPRRIVEELATEVLRNAAAAIKNCEHHLRTHPHDTISLMRRGVIRLLQWQDEQAETDFALCRAIYPVGTPRLQRYIEEALVKRARLPAGGSLYSHD